MDPNMCATSIDAIHSTVAALYTVDPPTHGTDPPTGNTDPSVPVVGGADPLSGLFVRPRATRVVTFATYSDKEVETKLCQRLRPVQYIPRLSPPRMGSTDLSQGFLLTALKDYPVKVPGRFDWHYALNTVETAIRVQRPVLPAHLTQSSLLRTSFHTVLQIEWRPCVGKRLVSVDHVPSTPLAAKRKSDQPLPEEAARYRPHPNALPETDPVVTVELSSLKLSPHEEARVQKIAPLLYQLFMRSAEYEVTSPTRTTIQLSVKMPDFVTYGEWEQAATKLREWLTDTTALELWINPVSHQVVVQWEFK